MDRTATAALQSTARPCVSDAAWHQHSRWGSNDDIIVLQVVYWLLVHSGWYWCPKPHYRSDCGTKWLFQGLEASWQPVELCLGTDRALGRAMGCAGGGGADMA